MDTAKASSRLASKHHNLGQRLLYSNSDAVDGSIYNLEGILLKWNSVIISLSRCSVRQTPNENTGCDCLLLSGFGLQLGDVSYKKLTRNQSRCR